MQAVQESQQLENPQAPFDHVQQRLSKLMQKRIFFVVGCQKSGTTWLQHLLNGHRDVRCNGETCLGPVLLPMLQQVASAYNQKQKVGQLGRFDEHDLRHLFVTAAGLLFRKWADPLEKIECIGEKTPEHALCLPLLDQAFPTCKVIHIIRDGRDIAVSGWFHNQRKANPKFTQRFPDLATYITYLVQSHWLPYIQRARAFGQTHPDRYLELRYEDLHQDPSPQIHKLLEFLGVDACTDWVDLCRQAGAFETLSQGRLRGQEDTASFFRKGVVGDWKNHLDSHCLDTFMQLGGTMLQDLGYH